MDPGFRNLIVVCSPHCHTTSGRQYESSSAWMTAPSSYARTILQQTIHTHIVTLDAVEVHALDATQLPRPVSRPSPAPCCFLLTPHRAPPPCPSSARLSQPTTSC